MGEHKHVRKIIQQLEWQIALHVEKISAELRQETPDHGLIRHWNKEIQTWTDRAERLRKRLPNKR